MTNGSKALCTVLVAWCICAYAAMSVHGADFVIAPDGNDANPGTAAKPFATLAKARDAVRELKQDGMTKDITVSIRAGEYVLDEPVVFGPEDSGSDGFRVIYRNADELGSVRFVGAAPTTGWQPHEGKIWKKTGVKRTVTTLYEDGQRGFMARAPNQEVFEKYPNAMAPYFRVTNGTMRTMVYAEGDLDPTGWELTDRAMVNWWGWAGRPDWGQRYAQLTGVDAETNTLHVIQPQEVGKNRVRKGDRGFVLNVYALLDASGEFFQDVENETLYYIPRGDNPNEADMRLPKPAVFVDLAGKDAETPVHGLVFSGLRFEYSNSYALLKPKSMWEPLVSAAAMFMRFAHTIEVEKCHFRNIGDHAIFARDGIHHCTFTNCRFEHIGRGGIIITNQHIQRGEHPELRAEHNLIYNCLIHDLGQIFVGAIYNAGVQLNCVSDTRVAHCDIARNIRYGISLRGHYTTQANHSSKRDMGTHFARNNVFEYIKISQVGTDSGDMGAIHGAHLNTPSGPNINTWRQIIVRDIYAHPSMHDIGPWGLYMDHPRSSQRQIFENIDVARIKKRQWKDNGNPVQTFRNVSWKPGFDRSRIETDRIGLTPEFPKEYGGQGLVDRTPPTHPQWADDNAWAGDSSVRIAVKPSTDDMSGVEYYFECLTEGGHDSGWQASPVYTDSGLKPETDYRYRARARDRSAARNQTDWSKELTVTTAVKSTAPNVARYTFEQDGKDATGLHHGQLSGGATFSTDAPEGKHALVCGKHHVAIPDHDDLDIGLGDFAISLWFYAHKSDRDTLRVLSKHDRGWQGYCVRGGDSVIHFDLGNGRQRIHISGKTRGPGVWQHLVVNVDRDEASTLYLDGKHVATQDIRPLMKDDINSGAPLTLGTGANLPWQGMIDDVRIYKRTLTKEEIQALAARAEGDVE